uniref:tumor necrosis factor receptor superfamily member 5-like isoform X1 n=2 Tax=Maylandia zebra TaxID=106582 RepID=UPI000D309815|nr:tumor necrosis factor receptor superfamily member 5-like isoform X1 [Maylandia zebra]
MYYRAACDIMLSALLIFGYAAVFMVPVLSCQSKEYKTNDGRCCPMCNKGRVVQRDCTAFSGTQCRPCEMGTFMNQPNSLYNCFPCTACDTGRGIFVKQNCTATTDTVCDVLNGYYCKGLTDSNRCSLAEKHSQCEAGQRIKEPGTSRSDTVCEDCQPGFFSKDGVNCTGWKTCSESQIKVEEGSSTSDVVCGSASRHRYVFISSVVLSLIIVICLVTTGFVKARKPDKSRKQLLRDY